MKIIVSFFMLILYFSMMFRNAIDLNEVTIPFTIMYVIIWLLILILIKFWRLITSNILKSIIVVLLSVQLFVICYEAYSAQPERLLEEQRIISMILGNSLASEQLHLSYDKIVSLKVLGDAKLGNFGHPFDYIIELKVKKVEEPYYFMCKGTGPYCNEMELVEKPNIDGY